MIPGRNVWCGCCQILLYPFIFINSYQDLFREPKTDLPQSTCVLTTEMEITWRTSYIFFFMLERKTRKAALCLLPFTCLCLWRLSWKEAGSWRTISCTCPILIFYLQMSADIRTNKNAYLILPQELNYFYMQLNTVLCEPGAGGSVELSVFHYLIVWHPYQRRSFWLILNYMLDKYIFQLSFHLDYSKEESLSSVPVCLKHSSL